MTELLEKAKTFLVANLPTVQIKKLGMKILFAYVAIVGFVTILNIITLFYEWLVIGQLIVKDWQSLLSTLVSPQMVAALGGVELLLIDKNHNGYSDDLENKIAAEQPFIDKK